MQIIEIYGKEYTCSKCNKQVNYGTCATDDGKAVTKDKKPYNNKFGKDSNKLSVAVNAGTKEIHPCYAANVIRDFEEITGEIKQQQPVEQIHINPKNREILDEFEGLVNDAYIKLYQMASRYNPDGTAHDKKLTTFGLMHDFFNFLATKR